MKYQLILSHFIFLLSGLLLLHYLNKKLKIQNEQVHKQVVTRKIDSSYIQFHFCLKGNAKFIFNQGIYALEVPDLSQHYLKDLIMLHLFYLDYL